MKILVLGNIQSKWVKEHIEYVLLPLGHTVEVLGDEKKCQYTEFYRDNGIVIHHLQSAGSLARRMPFVRIMSAAKRTVRLNAWGDYDLIVNLFVNYRDLMITAKIRGKETKTAMYFAGSELLRKSKAAVRLYNVCLPHTDYYVMGSQTLLSDFYRKFGKRYHGEVISFGISAFDDIDRLLKSGSVKRTGNAFCIGYSGVKEHQHIAVLELFTKLPENLKQKASLIVPMTYMASPEYIAEVKEKLEKTGIEYRQYTEYRNNEQMAELWCSTDYFINAQTTDSLSASVLESAYAGCELISPAWLNYPEYRDMGIQTTKYLDFDELYAVITDILEGRFTPAGNSNRQALHEAMSWEASRNKWAVLLASIENRK